MTPKSFAVVACRLLSIWFFVQATQSFANAISIVIATGSIGVAQRRAGSWVQIALPFAGAPMIYLGASAVLWLGVFVMAQSMTRGLKEERPENAAGIVGWQSVGFSVVGIFVFAQGLATLIGYLALMAWLSSANAKTFFGDFNSQMTTWRQVVGAVAQVLVGLALLFMVTENHSSTRFPDAQRAQ